MESGTGLLCAGDVLFNRKDASGNYLGLIDLGNTQKFSIKETSKPVERTLRGRATFGQLGSSVYIKEPAECSISADDFNAQAFSVALLGTSAALSQSSGTYNAGAPDSKTAKLGIWVPLAKGRVTSFVLKNSAQDTTYVLGTDYLLRAELGMFLALTGGAIADAATVKAEYGYGTVAGTRISGSAQPTVKGQLILDGINLDDQQPIVVTIDEANLAPNKEVDFKSQNFAGIELTGKLKTLPNKTSPYTVDLRGF
jgi:hypothetical protein